MIEDEGYDACLQRSVPGFRVKGDKTTNPEVNRIYELQFASPVAEGKPAPDVIIDYNKAAVVCGLGSIGLHIKVIVPKYGTYMRFVYIITDMELEFDEPFKEQLCGRCGKCVEACLGKAISNEGVDTWRCSVYYNGASGSKNPFMPPDAYADFEDRLQIIAGEAEIDMELAKKILGATYFYPPAKHFYRTSICGRACDRACYIHLEEKGVLTKKFHRKFREKEDWKLSTKQFVTGKREKEWDFTK